MRITKSMTPYKAGRHALFLVVHSTPNTEEEDIAILSGKTDREVSAHYAIRQNGEIIQFVDESECAWHCGQSWWSGLMHRDMNACSIGIELLNPHPNEQKFGMTPFPLEQIASLIALSKDIVTRHRIRADRVLGHQDIAPHRKSDPGKLLPWDQLAASGVGLWPELNDDRMSTSFPTESDMKTRLAYYGYDTRSWENVMVRQNVIAAFQTHFSPQKITGIMDAHDYAVLDYLCHQKASLESL